VGHRGSTKQKNGIDCGRDLSVEKSIQRKKSDMELREKIAEIIKDHEGHPDLASKEVLKYLNDVLSLEGNGWFDNDGEMLNFLINK
jgi:hypothetical protein